jgi:DNA-binding beta-propeller fold protein YncE
LPADVLVADHLNNRLVIIDPQGRIRWAFPRPGDLKAGQTFRVPDDAFFSPDGRYIIATQEDDQVITVISVATSKIVPLREARNTRDGPNR